MLSVIIPLYNVAPFIERCARSLMEQTLTEGIEFLFIDDASTDETLIRLKTVIQFFPQRNHQIRLIFHGQHQGVAAIRTEGIHLARGRYIGWCDGDDWCEPRMYQTMLDCALSENADIVVCDYLVHEAHGLRTESKRYLSNPREHVRRLYHQPDANLFLWNTIFSRHLFADGSVVPFPGIDVGEDQNLSIRLYCRANRLSYLPVKLYHHNNCNSSSVIHSLSRRSAERLDIDCRNTDAICDFLCQEGPEEFHLTSQFLRFQTKWGYDALWGYSREYYDLYADSHAHIMQFTGIPWFLRIKMALLFHSYFSFRIGSFVYSIISRFRAWRP